MPWQPAALTAKRAIKVMIDHAEIDDAAIDKARSAHSGGLAK